MKLRDSPSGLERGYDSTQLNEQFKYVADGRIRKAWPSMKPGGPIKLVNAQPKGMPNRGNFCYRLATLQCLLHTPVFYNYFRRLDMCSPTDTASCVFFCFRRLAETYWKSTNQMQRHHDVDNLNAAIRQHPTQYGEGVAQYSFVQNEARQQDPHEFVQGFLRMLRTIERVDLVNSIYNQSNLDWPRLFHLKQRSTWKCEDCNRVRETFQQDNCLSLSLESPRQDKPLTQYLRHHFGPNTLPGVRCDSQSCTQAQMPPKNRTRENRIVESPEILIIQLCRFGFNRNGGQYKIRDRVMYGNQLSLTEWTKSKRTLNYRLHGVVAHGGRRVDNGHYVAGLRQQIGVGSAIANDAVINAVSRGDGSLLNPYAGNKSNFTPYLLIYQKTGGNVVSFL